MPCERAEKAVGEVLAQVEELEFLCRFLAAAHLAQIVHLAAHGGLAEVFGVGEEGEVTFAEECGNDAGDEKEKQEGRVIDENSGEGDGCDRLLDQPAHLLNHGQPVSGLDAGAFEAVVKDRVFVDRDVKGGCLAHDLDTDVMGVAVGEQIVKVINRTRQDAGDDGERHFAAHQPPEIRGKRLVQTDAIHAVDDVAADDADAHGQKGNDDADGDVPENDGGTGFPNEVENRGDIFEGPQPIAPCVTGAFGWI